MYRRTITAVSGLALTLATMGGAGHEQLQRHPVERKPVMLVSNVTTTDHRVPQSQDGGGGGRIHVKGCRADAESRVTSHGMNVRFMWVYGALTDATELQRNSWSTYYYLCHHPNNPRKDAIKIHLHRACVTQTSNNPDHVYYQGTDMWSYAWEKEPGRGVDSGKLSVPDVGDRKGAVTCVRKRPAPDEREWLRRFRPHSTRLKRNVHERWAIKVKIWVLGGDDQYFYPPHYIIDPLAVRDHRLA